MINANIFSNKHNGRYIKFISVLLTSFLTVISPLNLFAGIKTDGSVGAAKIISGPNYMIPASLGTIKGTNLFHSFEKFSINKNQSATFTGPDKIANIISRVTGNEISIIDGLLESDVGIADFFFINPNGTVFGPNARIDVPAAFHISTAAELRFADKTIFSASLTETSTLTQAAPC